MSNQIKRILLVEDDTFISKMYSSKFINEGFEVDVAVDGEDGLSKAMTNEYDVIILDLVLPKLSGSELLQKLRQSDKGKNINVVVLTNLNDVEEKNKLENLNIKCYLDKSSLTPGQLVETLHTIN